MKLSQKYTILSSCLVDAFECVRRTPVPTVDAELRGFLIPTADAACP